MIDLIANKFLTSRAHKFYLRSDEFPLVVKGAPAGDLIQKFSTDHPDDLITCRITTGFEDYPRVSTVTFKAGKKNVIAIEPSYSFGEIPLQNLAREWICRKASAFFCKLDRLVTDKNGKLFIAWSDDVVTYRFTYGSDEGELYEIAATKVGYRINFDVKPHMKSRLERR